VYDALTQLDIKDPENRRKLELFATSERYRIENLLRIIPARTRKITPLRYNEAQIELYRRYRHQRDRRRPVRLVICKGRRAGLSTGVMSLIYDDTTTNPNTKSLIVANEKNPSENVLEMSRVFWQNTPETMTVEGYTFQLRPDLPPEFRNNPPKDKLFFDTPLGSKIYLASSKSLDAYLSFGFQNILATEASRYADGAELFRALQPTLINEAHSALYIESTPNGMDGPGAWFYDQVMTAYKNKASEFGDMELVFIPWHKMRVSFAIPFEDSAKRAAFERSLDPGERDVLRRFPFVSMEQLLWRRTVLRGAGFNQNEELFDQEFPSDLATAFLMSGTSVYARKSIKRMQAHSVRAPIWEGDIYWGKSDEANKHVPIHETVRQPVFMTPHQARENGFASHVNSGRMENLKVYRWPEPGERLLIAADIAGGREDTRDGDFSTICVGVMNPLQRDELIITWRGHCNELLFGEILSALGWALRRQVGEHVSAPLLIPEWTGPGKATCVYIDRHNLYAPVYLYQQPGKKGFPPSQHLGHESNDKTKPFMVGASVRMIDNDLIDIPDERLVIELSSYRQRGNYGGPGDFESAGGKHDDMVSALQILCMHLRLQVATLPGDDEVREISDAVTFEDADDPERWDPFQAGPVGIPGRQREMEENLAEALFWAS